MVNTSKLPSVRDKNSSSYQQKATAPKGFELAKEKISIHINNLGTSLCDKSGSIDKQCKRLRTVIQQPIRVDTARISHVTGCCSIYSGDFFRGGFITFLGLKELWNIFGEASSTLLMQKLNDIHADVGMIQTLEEANKQHLLTIKGNLVQIEQDVKSLNQYLQEIDQKKLEAANFSLNANDPFQQATIKLKLAQTNNQNAVGFFKQIDEFVQNEKANANLTLEEKLNKLRSLAKNVFLSCREGKNALEDLEIYLKKGIEVMNNATLLKEQAFFISSAAFQQDQDIMKFSAEKAEVKNRCIKEIDCAKAQMDKVKKNSEDIMTLIKELEIDVKAAKKDTASKIGFTDAFVGTQTTALFTSMEFLGPTAAAFAGISVVDAWHNGFTISPTAKKIYNYWKGNKHSQTEPMQEHQLVRFRFDNKSSGSCGYYVMERSSYTVGNLDINLGYNEIYSICYNLENTNKINKEDVLSLFQELTQKLTEKKLLPESCISILDRLETINITRGHHYPSIQGFIKKSDTSYCLFRMLRELCMEKQTVSI